MKSAKTIESRHSRPPSDAGAFTLIELVVVIVILAVLATMLAPALAATKPGSKMAQCLNSKRQLSLAWQMYASDNADSLVSALAWVGRNGMMDWSSSSANTNAAFLTNSAYARFAPYIKSAAVYKCPADFYQSPANPGPRVRSVSMSATVGGVSPALYYPMLGRTYIIAGGGAGPASKMSALAKPGPASTFVFLDEHPDSINDGVFVTDPGYPAYEQRWRDLPASYHNGAAGFSFADGHAEMHQWRSSTTIRPVTYVSWFPSIVRSSEDYLWVEDHMPYK